MLNKVPITREELFLGDSRKITRKKSRWKFRLQIIELLGGKCAKCGFSDIRALQIDHINGGGNKEFKKFNCHHAYYKHILEEIEAGSKDYQLLCANCNWIKRFEKGEFYGKSS